MLTVLRRGTRWGESLLYVLVVLGMFGGECPLPCSVYMLVVMGMFEASARPPSGARSLAQAIGHLHPTLRIRLQAESCPFKLDMPRFWKWPENPGDVAWRWRISR